MRRWQLYMRCKSLRRRLGVAAVAHYSNSLLGKCLAQWRRRVAYTMDVLEYTRCVSCLGGGAGSGARFARVCATPACVVSSAACGVAGRR